MNFFFFIYISIQVCSLYTLGLLNVETKGPNREKITPKASRDFIIIGDWGGQTEYPYTKIGQVQCAHSMGHVAEEIQADMVIALGDNFYHDGVNSVDDPRFKETFENVYTQPSLQIPWKVIAGNHDYYGNVTAQLLYTHRSPRWQFPHLWYAFTVDIPGGMTARFIMLDTVSLVGDGFRKHSTGTTVISQKGPQNQQRATAQWDFIQRELENSVSYDYVFVAGHYPVYSGCSHGNTKVLVDRLRPLMIKYKVTAYFSGHDHCLEHMEEDGEELFYMLSGSADMCCYPLENMKYLPQGILKFSATLSGKPYRMTAGYTTMSVSAEGVRVKYRMQNGKVLFTTRLFSPRKKNV